MILINYGLMFLKRLSGKPVFGKEGAFVPLLENILNAALKSEVNAHPDDDSR